MTKQISGKYFGTEIHEKWWRRYMKNKMLARGNGTFSYDDQHISFLRLLTQKPITIEFSKIIEFKIGKWHAGQWGKGKPILKVLWENENQLLSSGFSISEKENPIDDILATLNGILETKKEK